MNELDRFRRHAVKPDLRIVRKMPIQKPGKSKQDYGTPDAFMLALRRKFGPIQVDLAATSANTRAEHFISPEEDSFTYDWDRLPSHMHATRAFLNPPFGDIRPWAKKCAETCGLEILFLVPASVGSNWWAEYVDMAEHADHVYADHVGVDTRVYFLRPRISFDGKNPYPKDCALIHYRGPDECGYECWDWSRFSPGS